MLKESFQWAAWKVGRAHPLLASPHFFYVPSVMRRKVFMREGGFAVQAVLSQIAFPIHLKKIKRVTSTGMVHGWTPMQ